MHIRAFKSVAERTRIQKLVHEGTFPRGDFDDMAKLSEGFDLPERLTPKVGHLTPKVGQSPKLSVGRSTRYDGLAPSDRKTHY